MTDEQADTPASEAAATASPDAAPTRRHTPVWQLVAVGVAALFTGFVFVKAVSTGEPAPDASSGSTAGGGSDSGGGAPKAKYGYPFCRVDVTDPGDGYHVAVALANNLSAVWAVFDSPTGEQSVKVPLSLGMGQAALPTEVEPAKVVIWGTPDQQQYSAGCYWAPA
jgi:hypothetical protein